MGLSIGILAFSVNSKFIEMTRHAIASYRGAEEIILVENGPYVHYDDVDTYIRFSENQFFTKAANAALKNARQDYIAVVNNDTYLESGNLHDLCVPDTVTSPLITTQDHIGPFCGSFFVVPRTILDKIGFLDEQFKLYYSDSDYATRLKNAGIQTEQKRDVLVYHNIGSSTQYINDNPEYSRGLIGEDDKARYYRKYAED